MRRLSLLLPLLLAASLAAQTTYYVDAVNGKDTNLGTSRAAAWKSLTYASKWLKDNDTLYVLPGTYSATNTGETWPVQFGTDPNNTQNNVRIISEGGPAVTILDGEAQMSSSGVPMLRFRWEADGIRFSGFTLRNTGIASYWSMAVRLGSTSGANFAARNVEIDGCIFESCNRAIVIFGSDPQNGPNETTGIKIHDNLILASRYRAIAAWGGGDNEIYNNTFAKLNFPSNDDSMGIWIDSLFTATSKVKAQNNIFYDITGSGAGKDGLAIRVGSKGTTATIENNTAFKMSKPWDGFTPSATNVVADPMFVDATKDDYRLKAGSPAIQSGTAMIAIARHDLDRFPRLSDGDGDNLMEVDRGAYAYTTQTMSVGGTWAPGQSGQLQFAGQVGAGAVLIGTGAGYFQTPWGTLLIDPAKLTSITLRGAIPGTIALPIPNDVSLLGLEVSTQGLSLAPALRLLNGESRIL